MRRSRRVTKRRWPAQPLFDAVGGDNDIEVGVRLGVGRATIGRWRTDGIAERIADQMAVRHGVHPSHIWPDWFDRALADEDVAA